MGSFRIRVLVLHRGDHYRLDMWTVVLEKYVFCNVTRR